ncbi:biogenesis of lysosome-related organelles complex 1 subunit 5-like [Salvelinus namaycush]|uniref:Biogenesis of lysosome-related organelles complex 1 subunit 5 n=1 Tax=Salvelinus namaycush TaxID=8040 RepID=A0A8U0PSV4_SALNM|nr:biogenesis of lysosome-related organelles complex 1 subunit 5-like [Salvelinus namaycush]
MDKLAIDVGDIQSRLMACRTRGDLLFCEFEEKHGFRERRFLDNLNKMVVETNEQSLPKCSEHMHRHLCEALTRLEDGNHTSHRIQERELEADQVKTQALFKAHELPIVI